MAEVEFSFKNKTTKKATKDWNVASLPVKIPKVDGKDKNMAVEGKKDVWISTCWAL